MRKKLLVLTSFICLIAMVGMTGCGSSNPYGKYDISEYVTLGEYKGLERSDINVSVSDEEVDTQIQTNLKETSEKQKKTSGTVEDGDVVNIDYEGKINGKVFDGGSADGYDLEIGSGSFIDGFESGLVGKQIGGTYDLDLTFPKDYNSTELAGKEAVFTVTVNYASYDVVPELTDEWVKKNSDVKTVEEYRILVKENLLDSKEETAKNNAIASMWDKVVSDSKMKEYPEKELDKYIGEIEDQYEQMADSYGVTLEELLKSYNIESEEVYDQQNKDAAETYIKDQMIMYYIAELEGLSYTEEEADQLREDIKAAGYDDESFKAYYGQDIESYIDSALTYSKVGQFIFDNSIVTGDGE